MTYINPLTAGLEIEKKDIYKLPFFSFAGFMLTAILFCTLFINQMELEPEMKPEKETAEAELEMEKEETMINKWKTESNW